MGYWLQYENNRLNQYVFSTYIGTWPFNVFNGIEYIYNLLSVKYETGIEVDRKRDLVIM